MGLGRNSRFRHTVVVRVVDANGQLLEPLHLDIRPRLVGGIYSDTREYSPTNRDNWSRIAWRFLGDGRFWWIIADLSGVVDPFTDLHPKETLHYLSQLDADLSLGEQGEATVVDTSKIHKGEKIRIEDLNPSSPISVDVTVLTVDDDTGKVSFSPVDVPSPGIPKALSRVSRIIPEQVKLHVPSVSRALFEAMDFDDSLQTLVD